MDLDVETAIAALLEQRGEAIAEKYTDQDLAVEYDGEEYDSLEALADDLAGTEPDAAGVVTYDALETALDGDAVYHELLHGELFASERPAAKAVERMRMEADDRTTTARGGDDAGGGLAFHVEEDPFIAVWSGDDGVRYTAIQLVPEARSASCRRTEVTYPGKVFAVTGTVSDIPGPDALIADEADRGENPGEEDAREDELVCGVDTGSTPPVPETPEPSDSAVPGGGEPEPEEHTPLDELYGEVFGDSETFGYAEYEAIMGEAATNVVHMRNAVDTMMKYINSYQLERIDEAAEDVVAESSDFYADRLEEELDQIVSLPDGGEHESLPRAVYVTLESVRHLLEDEEGYRERFRAEKAEAYDRLHDVHPATPAQAGIVEAYSPDPSTVNPTHPVVLLSTFATGGRDALDTHLEKIFDQLAEQNPVEEFDGNDTTDRMFQ